jgi:hypothetical protein
MTLCDLSRFEKRNSELGRKLLLFFVERKKKPSPAVMKKGRGDSLLLFIISPRAGNDRGKRGLEIYFLIKTNE